MGAFSNFAVSFTIISILSGCLTLFGFGMAIGGPASSRTDGRSSASWSRSSRSRWPRCARAIRRPAACTTGRRSSRRSNGPAWSWFTGWFNMLGQVAITAGIDFGFAAFFCAFLNIAFDVDVTQDDPDRDLHRRARPPRPAEHVRRPAGRALQRRERVVARGRRARHRRASSCSSPDQHTSFATIFSFTDSSRPTVDGTVATGGFINGTGFSKPVRSSASRSYIFLIGMLLAQYTITGYDASAHMTEETHDADVSGPEGDLEVGRDLRDLRLHPAARRSGYADPGPDGGYTGRARDSRPVDREHRRARRRSSCDARARAGRSSCCSS